MALRHHGHVAHGQLQGTAALLLGDQAGDRPIHLAGEEALGAHGHEPQHPVQGLAQVQVLGRDKGGQVRDNPAVREGLLRNLAEQLGDADIHRGGVVQIVVDHEAQVAGDLAQDLAGHLLAGADGLEAGDVLRADEQAHPLLVLGHVDLEHGHGRVADADVADFHPAAGVLDQFLEHVGRAARALVVDHVDEAQIPHLVAGADHPVHLLFHLGVAALDGVEVKRGFVLTLEHGRGRAAAEADPVGRAAHLDDEHALHRLFLFGVAVVDLADAAGEHDRLQEAPALAGLQAQIEAAGEALDERLAELVAVVRGAVARLDLDLQRRRQGVRAGVGGLPLERIVRDVQVGHAVAGRAGHDQAAPAGALDVADAAAGAGLGAGEGGHAGGEVVRLGGEQRVVGDRVLDKRRGRARLERQQRGQLGPANDARVVLEGHQAALGVGGQGVGDHLEQGPVIDLAVDHLAAAEKAVARVLGVGVVQVHDLDDGRVAAAALDEVVVVQLPVPLVHARAGDVQEAVRALGQQVHLVNRLRDDAGLEGGERCRVGALGHAVVVAGDEPVQVFTFGHQVAARALHPGDAVQAHSPADGHQVGRPGSGEVEPGADFDHPLAAQLRLEGDRVEEKAVGQDEPQPFHLRGGHGAGVGDVEAVGEVGADPPVELGDECGHDGIP